MGYPTSVFSPAARSNGQTIDASHVNDLQTEVTAIENELLGTITGSLNVSGASTLATLQAAGSTFSVRPVTPPPDAVKVYLESTVTIGSSASSTIAWTAEDFKINSSLHSTATNPARLIPQSTGLYQFVGHVTFALNSSGTRQVVLRDSSNAAFAQGQVSSQANAPIVWVQGYKRFDVTGGYVVVEVALGGASTMSLDSGLSQTQMTMVKL